MIMGVSGSGKSTVGELLASQTGWPFYDGDDYHPPANVRKMSDGIPLNDEDRECWLRSLADLIEESNSPMVIACSALKESYRELLKEAQFVFLDGTPELVEERLRNRGGHFMPAALLESQFATLERPDDVLTLDIARSPEHLVSEISEWLKTTGD